jgi:hypothetical protein
MYRNKSGLAELSLSNGNQAFFQIDILSVKR